MESRHRERRPRPRSSVLALNPPRHSPNSLETPGAMALRGGQRARVKTSRGIIPFSCRDTMPRRSDRACRDATIRSYIMNISTLQRFNQVKLWLPSDARDDDAFMSFAERVVDELSPRSALEECAAARHLEALWRLRPFLLAADSEGELTAGQARARTAAEQSLARAEAAWSRTRRAADFEERCQKRREKAAAPRSGSAAKPSEQPSARSPDRPPPPQPLLDYRPPAELAEDEPIDWRNYVHLDPGISPEWPVFKGTTFAIEHVLARLGDAIPESDILRAYPFLTRTQIRAAKLYDIDNPAPS